MMRRERNKVEPPRPEDQWASQTEHQAMIDASEEFLRLLVEKHPEKKPEPNYSTKKNGPPAAE